MKAKVAILESVPCTAAIYHSTGILLRLSTDSLCMLFILLIMHGY